MSASRWLIYNISQIDKTKFCEYESDLPSNEHYLSSGETKASVHYCEDCFHKKIRQVVLITAKIALIFTSLSAVQIYDFHIFTVI